MVINSWSSNCLHCNDLYHENDDHNDQIDHHNCYQSDDHNYDQTDGDLGAAVMTRESWSQLALSRPPVNTQTREDISWYLYITLYITHPITRPITWRPWNPTSWIFRVLKLKTKKLKMQLFGSEVEDSEVWEGFWIRILLAFQWTNSLVDAGVKNAFKSATMFS